MQELAFIISKEIAPDIFKRTSPEEALTWLETNTLEVGNKYKEFINRHGARCTKELDLYAEPWETNPLPLIKSLQEMVNDKVKVPTDKTVDSFSTILSKLKIKFNFIESLKLRWALPYVRWAVRGRECSKSAFTTMMNRLREAFNHMGNQMVLEGRLLKKEHACFLTLEELRKLTKTRSPDLTLRAARRWKCHGRLNKYVYEEITFGIPKPINQNETIPAAAGFMMTGIPVSQGIVKATARVIKTLAEAPLIQNGEILITYATDIAWSPYFPLLAGLVTELGGLISHGAVVAREYGLPYVAALHGATRTFKSGDLVILDGNKGTLQKVED